MNILMPPASTVGWGQPLLLGVRLHHGDEELLASMLTKLLHNSLDAPGHEAELLIVAAW